MFLKYFWLLVACSAFLTRISYLSYSCKWLLWCQDRAGGFSQWFPKFLVARMRPAGTPHLLESLLMRSWENWQKPQKGENSYQSQFWTTTYGAVLQSSFHSRFRVAGEKKIRSLNGGLWIFIYIRIDDWILPLPSVRNTPTQTQTWRQKVSGKQSFNDGLARLGVWWVGTSRVITMSNLSLAHKSLPQFLIR